jgi:hypothetical protein
VSITTTTTPTSTRGPALPMPRGPVSAAVLAFLRGAELEVPEAIASCDPWGDDLHLALYVCYELHYRGFVGVDDELEWNPQLLTVRSSLEQRFLQALRAAVPGGEDVAAEIASLVAENPGEGGVSHHLRRKGELWQLREYIALRSAYHLKEADPQAWVIPRLEGAAKAALVSVEHDEYGAGRGERMHAQLFADMMRDLGLSDEYGHYLDHAPAPVLAEVNFMSMAGLHRALRGALVGQFAVVELTSSPGSARLVAAAQRLGCGPATVEFYSEHVEADAVHEQIVRTGIIAPLLAADPGLAADVVFGVQAANHLDERLGEHVMDAWAAGRSALLQPLDDAVR